MEMPKIGTMVKIRLPHATEPKGYMTVAGIFKRIMPDGRLEIKTQQHGYAVVKLADIIPCG